jgi:uncharacterized protein (TIGR03086 family)
MAMSADEVASAEVADRYERIAVGFTARLEGCTSEQWVSPTPCTEWTTADIATHVIGVHQQVLTLLDGGNVKTVGDGVDLLEAWRDASALMLAELRDRARATRVVVTPFGEMPFEALASRVVCSDTLVHTWDVARATGQDEHLDVAATEFAWTWMEPAGARLRASGDFGPAVDPPPEADIQVRLLCFLGREAR